ncbi:MAG TPA: hydroxyisourate hydrolase [Thermoanaerobaculia bacterium]|jgi:5-hydroxyisourate hydrolase|nr:hydroxyisourate hydrolase [Thermoanaerobaculia bacterium]
MSGITTHVLDTARGRPASGVPVVLEIRSEDDWLELGRSATDDDGRVRQLLPAGSSLVGGSYRLTFQTETYFMAHEIEGFYPEVSIVFEVRDAAQHYHVPLLLSPFGYSTYRGS